MGDITDSIQQLSTTSREFKHALKVLIKYEINCLLKRLSDTGEEAIVITTSIEDGVQGHLGTVKGEGFLQATSHVNTLKEQFLQFCTDPTLISTENKMNDNSPVDFSTKAEHTRCQSTTNGKHSYRTKHHLPASHKSSSETNPLNTSNGIPTSQSDYSMDSCNYGRLEKLRDSSSSSKNNIYKTDMTIGSQSPFFQNCKDDEKREFTEEIQIPMDSRLSQVETTESNMRNETRTALTSRLQNYTNERHDTGMEKLVDSPTCRLEETRSKEIDLHCIMDKDRLYPLEPRNRESTFFQESDTLGIVCKKEEVRKMFERTEENGSLLDHNGGDPNSHHDENGTSVKDKVLMNGKALKNERTDSPIGENCRKRIRDRLNNKSMPYKKSLCQRTNQKFHDPDIRDEHVYSNDIGKREAHASLYNDFASEKMFGFYPAINSNRENHFVSRRELESLHQFYFGGMNDDYDGELIDCSLKKENLSRVSSDEESLGMIHLDKGTKCQTSDLGHQLEYKRHSNSVIMSPERCHRHLSDDIINELDSGKSYCEPRCSAERTCTTEEYFDKNPSNSNLERSEDRHLLQDVSGQIDKTQIDHNSRICEPVNLKMEPEEKTQHPVVKIEPGAESPTTIEKMLSDPNMPNYTLQGQGHLPTSTLTMHLNFSCRVCGQNFKNRQYRDFHVRLHESSHHFYCNLCSAGFDNETDCKNHQSEHREPVFQCESCGYRCTREFRMRAHKEICGSPSKIYKCPFCYKQFAAQRYMRIHIKSHDAHNVHTCPVCHNTYPLKNSLLKHMKKKHYHT